MLDSGIKDPSMTNHRLEFSIDTNCFAPEEVHSLAVALENTRAATHAPPASAGIAHSAYRSSN